MNMKSILSVGLVSVLLTTGLAMGSDLLITGVYDGPLTGGTPKGVELYVENDIPDLSVYGLGSANNGGGTDGEEFTFPPEAAFAGSFIYVTNNEGYFNDYFGFFPGYASGAMSINGDDAIELFQNGSVVDVFGDINVDGNGTKWEYLDGWVYRNDDSMPNGGIFNAGDFFYSGPNALDGCSTNDSCGSVMPIGTYTPGGEGPLVIIVEQMGYSFVPDVIDVHIGDTVQWIWGNGDHSVVDSNPGTCDDVGMFFDEDLDSDNQIVEWTVTKNASAVITYICDKGSHCDFGMTGVINVLDVAGPDSDGDGWEDTVDNCPNIPNPGQEDCNGDGVGDACDASAVDCNANGVPDDCDILEGDAWDCNNNGVPDSCDYADGVLHDDNGNGFPDECENDLPFIQLQEIRIDQPDADDDEYFEIRGDQSMDLTGVWYLVIGDGSGDTDGVIECAIDLSAMAIPANGSLLVAEDDDTLGVQANYVLSGNALNFENSDNVTHVLVMNFYGFPGDDLDFDDDGVLDVEPWQDTIDGVNIIETTDGSGNWTYLMDGGIGPTTDGYAPSHVYRYTSACGNFEMGTYDPYDPGSADTPGSENPACPINCPADIDGDGTVAVTDILILIGGWGGNDPTHDLDGDGAVGVGDILIVIGAWGPC
jgi:plastocyanin